MAKKKENKVKEFIITTVLIIGILLLLHSIAGIISNGVSKGYTPEYLYKVEHSNNGEVRSNFILGTKKEVLERVAKEDLNLENITGENWNVNIIFIN